MKNLTKKQLLFLSKVYESNDITNVMGHIEDMVEKKYYWYCIEQWEDYYFNN